MLIYRKEIDGLRAIAVLAVILFHANFLPQGFLGVDVFFVISGYLITSIINQQLADKNFSLRKFYLRRIRRIVPMLLLISIIALAIGYFTLLPDDFENLNESIIASSLFANNILLSLTRGYWDIANTYKPLLHTLSLGVEEQFYLFFPLLLMAINKWVNKPKNKLIIIGILIILSFGSNFIAQKNTFHFYAVSSRFYQLALGALLAGFNVTKSTFTRNSIGIIGLITIIILLLTTNPISPFTSSVIITIATCALLFGYNKNVLGIFLENKPIIFLGKISYSVYLWHHLVFCFYSLTYADVISMQAFLLLSLIIFALSIVSYYYIENPFRNKQVIHTTTILLLLGCTTVILLSISVYFYHQKGIVRDVPEIDVYKNKSNDVMAFWQYNERVYAMDTSFANNGKPKLLVIGNSFARDFVNMLLENNYTNTFDISFRTKFLAPATLLRVKQAEYIIIGNPMDSNFLNKFYALHHLDKNKILIIGTKNFGTNNNLIFNTIKPPSRCSTRVHLLNSTMQFNKRDKQNFPNQLVDIIGLLKDSTNQIPIFTPDCKLISQDYKHLTKYGAKYIGSLLQSDSNFNRFITHLSQYKVNQKNLNY